MNFELKTLSLAAAAKSSTDTLIVLISKHFKAGNDPLSDLIDKAIKAKDLSGKSNLLFRRDSQTGALHAIPRLKSWGELNAELHKN